MTRRAPAADPPPSADPPPDDAPASKAPPIALPKTLGACADFYYRLNQERLDAEKAVARIREKENFVKNHLINNIPKADATGVTGKVARVTRRESVKPSVKDWSAFYAYVKKTGRFEFLQKRVGEGAIAEVWDAGKDVPGVEKFTHVSLSVGKV